MLTATTIAPVKRKSMRFTLLRLLPKPLISKSTRLHELGTRTCEEFQLLEEVARFRKPTSCPGPVKLLLSHIENRLYGVMFQVAPARLMPAHIDALGRLMMSLREFEPSTLTSGSREAVLVAPREAATVHPAPLSIGSN